MTNRAVLCACKDYCSDVPEGKDDPYAVCKGLPDQSKSPQEAKFRSPESAQEYWAPSAASVVRVVKDKP